MAVVSSETAKLWDELESRGAQRQHWIENAPSKSEEKCPIKPSSFKVEDLDGFEDTWGDAAYYPAESMSVTEEVMGIPAPPRETWKRFERLKVDPAATPVQDSRLWHLHCWEGNLAPGIIFIENMFRRPGAGSEAGPRSSQMAQAAYQSAFPIDTLKHVIVCDVIHKETKRFVKRQLYDDRLYEDTGIEWPSDQLVAWEYDTPEYKVLLGTKIGAVVSWIVLGAFKRGTRRISQICTVAHYGRCMLMRFDIETIKSGPMAKAGNVLAVVPACEETASEKGEKTNSKRKRDVKNEDFEPTKRQKA
ncbi:uncharacterized protein N7484_000095 [Penicillium longicatenatum]|uniref:uncharacterized protein n=1 Tax=Penicillium longicatenatum TaxID=1561947 RepID=UPI002547A056|nr:uncharacterized protein N7484_000095 [Penicillium longicatenatum]KAJ5660723.1 hypothetical protein N7484_000095 [Penicillium longicatenatum]